MLPPSWCQTSAPSGSPSSKLATSIPEYVLTPATCKAATYSSSSPSTLSLTSHVSSKKNGTSSQFPYQTTCSANNSDENAWKDFLLPDSKPVMSRFHSTGLENLQENPTDSPEEKSGETLVNWRESITSKTPNKSLIDGPSEEGRLHPELQIKVNNRTKAIGVVVFIIGRRISQ